MTQIHDILQHSNLLLLRVKCTWPPNKESHREDNKNSTAIFKNSVFRARSVKRKDFDYGLSSSEKQTAACGSDWVKKVTTSVLSVPTPRATKIALLFENLTVKLCFHSAPKHATEWKTWISICSGSSTTLSVPINIGCDDCQLKFGWY